MMHAPANDISAPGTAEADRPPAAPRQALAASGMSVIDDLMSGGELLPAQLPSASYWSPERRLAGAVLASALIEIRDHHGSPGHRRKVAEALEWWIGRYRVALSFLPLCQLFDLEPDWVRGAIHRWAHMPLAARKAMRFLYRQAA